MIDLLLAYVAGGLTTAWALALATVLRRPAPPSSSEDA